MNTDQLIEEDDFIILPTLTPEEEAKMEKQHRERLQNFYQKNKNYEFGYWYPTVKAFTYPSFPFPLSCVEAYVLHCNYYDTPLTGELEKVQSNLIEKINNILAKHKNEDNQGKFFMKLSTRSPKDYCWDYRDERVFEEAVCKLKSFLYEQKVNNETSTAKLNNLLYKFFLLNCQDKLSIKEGNDFIRIFSKSERIISDINDLSYLAGNIFEKLRQNNLEQSKKNEVLIEVWGRDWADCLWSEQFRTFFNNNKLTAITQYDQRCFFQELPANKQKISSRCQDFYQQIKPYLQTIGLQKGVMDLIITENSIQLMEINVFDREARASLFNWTKDYEILSNGPLQIRVLEHQIQISKAHLGSIMGMIDKKSIDVITTVLEDMNLLELWK